MPTKVDSSNALAAKRDLYIEGLNEAYIGNYGDWLLKQSQEKQARISKKMSSMRYGMAVMAPLTCKGPDKCPFFHACPIPEMPGVPGPLTEYPLNNPCVLEVGYITQQVVSYIDQLKVDPNDPVEMSLINELALIDLLKNRAVLILSGGDKKGNGRDMMMYEETIIGWDPDGNPNTTTTAKVHPAIDIMEKHEKRRTKILDKFNATRESKVRLYGGDLEKNNKLMRDIDSIRTHLESAIKNGILMDSSSDEPIKLDDKTFGYLPDKVVLVEGEEDEA